MSLKLGTCFLLIALSMSGCFFDEPESQENVILIEDVLFVSSTKVRILARVFSTDEIKNHGVEFSKDENFTEVLVGSLGNTSKSGQFIVEKDSLEQKTDYYYRAFAEIGESKFITAPRLISTYEASVLSYNPSFGSAGEIVTIEGINLTNTLEVFFGDYPAEIVERVSDYRLKVRVPTQTESAFLPIRVILDGEEEIMDDFEYVTGKWTLLNTFDFRIIEPAIFVKQGRLHLIGGATAQGELLAESASMDLETLEWDRREYEGYFPTYGAFYNESGIVGSGVTKRIDISIDDFYYEMQSEVYEFDGTDLVIKNVVPLTTYGSLSFKDENGSNFVIGGEAFDRTLIKTVYELDVTRQWSVASTFDGILDSRSPNSIINGSYFSIDMNGSWWKFDSDSKELKQLHPFEHTVLPYGVLRWNDDELYVGLFQFKETLWRMDLIDIEQDFIYNLVPKTTFPGLINNLTIASYSHDGKLYFLRLPTSPNDDEYMNLWQFEPNEFSE